MSNSTPKSRWARVMRRTSSVLTMSRPGTPSIVSDRDADTTSLSGSTKGRDVPVLSPSLPPLVLSAPSPIPESPLHEAEATRQETVGPSPLAQPTTSSEAVPPLPATLPPPVEEAQSPAGYIPPPVLDSTIGNPGAFTDEADELPQPDIARDPYADIEPVEEEKKPEGYTPPPVIDSTVGNHGAFTDEPDELPQPDVARDPYTVEPVEEVKIPAGYTPPPVIDSSVGNHGSFTDGPDELPQPDTARDPYSAEPVTTAPENNEPEPEATPLVEEPTPYFDKPIAESIKDVEPADNIDNTNTSVHENANAISSEPDHGHGEAEEYYRGDVVPATSEAVHEDVIVVLHETDLGHGHAEVHHHDVVIPVTAKREGGQQAAEPIPIPVPVPRATYELPSFPMNMGSGQEVWGGDHEYERERSQNHYQNVYASSIPIINPSAENPKQVERSPEPSTRMPEADPFADPVAPRITVSHPDFHMPQPQLAEEYNRGPAENHRGIHGPIVMPLPSFHDVAHSRHIHQASSSSSLRGGDSGKFGVQAETDETLPLLSRPVTPNKYLQTKANPHSHSHNVVSVSPLVFSASQSTTSNGNANSWDPHSNPHPRLHTLGWLEYHLPDGTVYYVHPTSRVTTEINLRSERILTNVERFLADHGKGHSGVSSAMEGTAATGGEMWLRDVGTAKSGMVLERWWVDHRIRAVVVVSDEHEHGRKGSGKGKTKKRGAVFAEEDQLDTEYRYWSFIEAHPAHNSLSAKAKMEALDVLSWAWTERLLPSHRTVPAPFTQEECQELMTLIRSFGDNQTDDHGIQTRIVSRILLRVAHWRQTYFRPNKPLPTDVGVSPSRLPTLPRKPFRRAIVDFLVSCLFLGIPYIFYERARHSFRIDEESGVHNATPTLVIGACTCLVAAIVLSASVTFISLPGLDAFSRTAGMVAILFAAFSMAATIVAIFRHKADLERPISHVGIEGIMVITRRTIVLSLPLVFLAYSIIGFITGIVLYSFKGVALDDPSMTRKSFEDYTRWGVVGVVGVLGGMVTTTALLHRR